MEFLSPPRYPRRPQQAAPSGSVDCHAMFSGRLTAFHCDRKAVTRLSNLQLNAISKCLITSGLPRVSLVQPSAYGTDCRALVHALSHDPSRLRGVAVITPDISDPALSSLHLRGICGARFTHLSDSQQFTGTVGFEALTALAPRLIELGWHAQLWTDCHDLLLEACKLSTLGLPIVVDHMGLFNVTRGVDDAGFQKILGLLGDGHIWLKLTAYRLSKRFPNYEDIAPFHRKLLAANPSV